MQISVLSDFGRVNCFRKYTADCEKYYNRNTNNNRTVYNEL